MHLRLIDLLHNNFKTYHTSYLKVFLTTRFTVMKVIFIMLILSIIASVQVMALKNPATTFCIEQGYEHEIRKDSDGNEFGVCIVEGREYEEWDLLRKENSIVKVTINISQSKNHYNKENIKDIRLSNIGSVQVENRASLQNVYVGSTGSDNIVGQINISPTTIAGYQDWRAGRWTSPVRSQGGVCGSCWAFAATGVIETMVNIALQNPEYDIDLSEQDLIGCSSAGDCSGGWASNAFNHIIQDGITRESCTPYRENDLMCIRCPDAKNELVRIKNTVLINPTIQSIEYYVSNVGPVTAYLFACNDFQAYQGGIYRHSNRLIECDESSGLHEIIIVGYKHGEYWIIKNSWGSGWGEDGFARIAYSETVTDFYSWLNDGNDQRVFFIDDSRSIIGTDIDDDGINDNMDNCPEKKNPYQEDSDKDDIGDICDSHVGIDDEEEEEEFNEDMDTDEDGIIDNQDACPEIYGDNCNGCPEVECETCTLSICPEIGRPYCINSSIETVCGTKGCDDLDTECRDYQNVTLYCDGSGKCEEEYSCEIYTDEPSTTQCGADFYEYSCELGNEPGNDTAKRFIDQHCSGEGSCTADIGEWEADKECDENEQCLGDGTSFQYNEYFCAERIIPAVICNTEADTDCDNIISNQEMAAYADKWYKGENITNVQIATVASAWHESNNKD